MFGRAWKIGSIGGVAIRVDSSWVFVAILFTYSFWLEFTDPSYALRGPTAFGLAIMVSALFFSSVLVHELAHAGVARARGIAVSGITLYFFGGATSARLEDRGPLDEFLVTVVGPGSTLVLAGVFELLSRAARGALSIGLGRLAWINVLLGLFNLIPGFPLDGGRILRSAVWRVTGSVERATTVAAGVGQVVGAGLIALGVIQTARTQSGLSLWFVVIGWMLLQAARAAVRQQRVRQELAGAFVRQAMRAPPRAIPADTALSAALDEYLRGHEQDSFPVVDDDDRLLGLLTFDSAAEVGREDPLRPVRDAIVPLSEVMTVRADEPLEEVSERLAGRAALVLDGTGRLVGAIQPIDVSRWLRSRS